MQKALFTLLAGAIAGAPLFAQATISPCGPAVWHIDTTSGAKTNVLGDFPELNNLAFGMTEVAQLCIIPNPAGGGYIGAATVYKPAQTNFDSISFTWNGPGSNPVVTTDCDLLNGPADEFQASLSIDGLAFCSDTGAGHPIGNGVAILSTRTTVGAQFAVADTVAMVGVPGGYIDPCLGRINGQNVLFFADATGPIKVGDIDLNRASATYGTVSNIRIAVPSQTVTGFQFDHSPSSQYDNSGNTVALCHSVYASGGGSDSWYQSAPDLSRYTTAPTLYGMTSFATTEDGTAWNNNPAVIKGTAVYAHAGSYTDVRRIEMVTLSSCYLPATGGTVRNVLMTPMSVHADTVVSAVNYGFILLPTPINLGIIPGLTGYGNLCVGTAASVSTGPVVGGEVVSTFPFAGGVPAGAALYAEGVCLNLTAGEVYSTNVAYVQFN